MDYLLSKERKKQNWHFWNYGLYFEYHWFAMVSTVLSSDNQFLFLAELRGLLENIYVWVDAGAGRGKMVKTGRGE